MPTSARQVPHRPRPPPRRGLIRCWRIRTPCRTRRARVNEMFSAIAPSYDLNNRLHSMWMDQHWRSVAVKMAEVKGTDTIC